MDQSCSRTLKYPFLRLFIWVLTGSWIDILSKSQPHILTTSIKDETAYV